MDFYPRWQALALDGLIEEEMILLVQGPRGVGKSTLLRGFAAGRAVEVIDFGDDQLLAVAAEDPAAYLDGRADPVLVDEFQRLPSLLRVAKQSVDRRPRRGAFVLTGSTTRLLPEGSESLAGRSHDLILWGLSQGELRGQRESFVDDLFDRPASLLAIRDAASDRSSYVRMVARGGFPEAIRRQREDARRRWFLDYAARVADRDLASLVRLREPRLLSRLLRSASARTAQILNVTDLASDLDTTRETIGAYLSLLESVFLLDRLPAYSRNLNARLARHPKLHVVDSGLAAALSNLDEGTMGRSARFGSLLETFVLGEVRKQLGWSSVVADAYHYRDRDGHEVDIVLEDSGGRVVGIEVKAGRAVGRADAGRLVHLASRLGEDFVHGVVLYTGSASIRLSDDARITAHPVSALWH